MPTILESEYALAGRYRANVPETSRRVPHPGKRDKIYYTMHPSGNAV